jgi:hypothetical protein
MYTVSNSQNVDDYLFEEDLFIENEHKSGDHNYKLPPKLIMKSFVNETKEEDFLADKIEIHNPIIAKKAESLSTKMSHNNSISAVILNYNEIDPKGIENKAQRKKELSKKLQNKPLLEIKIQTDEEKPQSIEVEQNE